MSLYELATTILALSPGPISRVRFAKTIYFVHKELTRKKLMKIDDIAYLRLPLGPVPEGFMALAAEHPEIRARRNLNALSYEAEEYLLDLAFESQAEHQKTYDLIQKILLTLASHSTSELVRLSHDPSWQTHHNGERYFLTPADLRNTFPFLPIRINIRFGRPTPSEIGALQATLLRGMLKDIVKESTDLEYPDDKPAGAPNGTSKSTGSSPQTPTNHVPEPPSDPLSRSTPDHQPEQPNPNTPTGN